MLGELRPDLAVGEPARRGAGLVRPLAQGPRHRDHRRAADPLRAARRRASGARAESWPPPARRIASSRCAPTARSTTTRASPGARDYLVLGAGLGRAEPSPIDPPSMLTWTSAAARRRPRRGRRHRAAPRRHRHRRGHRLDRDAAGRRPRRRRSPTSPPAGCGRACARSTRPPAAPARRCCRAARRSPCPIGEVVEYRIPLVPNARRFAAGHRIRLVLTSDDQDPDTPAIMGFRHASVGTSSLQHGPVVVPAAAPGPPLVAICRASHALSAVFAHKSLRGREATNRLVHAAVAGHLGVKRRRQHPALPHRDGMARRPRRAPRRPGRRAPPTAPG